MNSGLPEKKTPLESFLGLFLEIRQGEGIRSIVMFAYFCLVMMTYYLIKPATRALMMETFGAGKLPLGNFSTALIIGFAVVAYDFLAGRFRRHHLVSILTSMAVATLLFIYAGLNIATELHTRQAFALLYFVFADVYSVMGTTLFWSLTHDLFTTTEGKRLYGLIGGGGALGGILGGLSAGWLSSKLGTKSLSIFAIFPLVGTVALAFYIVSLTKESPADVKVNARSGGKPSGSGIDGLRLIAASRYLQMVTSLVSIVLFASLIVETQFNLTIEEAIPTTDERTSFMGYRDTQLTLIQFLSQVLLTAPLIRYFGIRGVLLIMPVGNLLMGTFFFLAPSLMTANWAKIFDGSLKYGTNQVTKEILYLPTSPDVKYQAKAFIDVFFHRIAKGLAAALILFLTQACGCTKTGLFLPLGIFCGIWIIVIFYQYKLYCGQLGERILEVFPQPESSIPFPSIDEARENLKKALSAESPDLTSIRNSLLALVNVSPEENALRPAVALAWEGNSREGQSLAVEWMKIRLSGNLLPMLNCFSPTPPSLDERLRLAGNL